MCIDPAAPQPPTQQELALDRTHLAHERTLMAWIRTSMSMVSFGFTINELFGFLGQASGGSASGPRILGLGLIALGTVALIGASLQHALSLRSLGEQGWLFRRSLALAVATLMSAGGIVAFLFGLIRALSQ